MKKWILSQLDQHDNLLAAYLRSVLLWNPAVSILILMVSGRLDLIFTRFLICEAIGAFVSTFCFSFVALVILGRRGLAKWHGREFQSPTRRWSLSLSLVVMPLGLYFAFPFYNLWARWLGGTPIEFDFADYRLGLFIGFMISTIFFLMQSRRDARDAAQAADLRAKGLEAESLRAQVSALTAQMNPHLLFNSLNTVASLVASDPVKAEETVVQLSQLYRGVLSSSQKLVHPLARELEICRWYLQVERARFGERVQVEFNIHEDINIELVMVPALSLQPLVENAVKHGLAPRASGGRIFILADRMNDGRIRLRVEDDGVGLNHRVAKPVVAGSGTALKNTADRLRLQYGTAGDLSLSAREGGGTTACIHIPGEPA